MARNGIPELHADAMRFEVPIYLLGGLRRMRAMTSPRPNWSAPTSSSGPGVILLVIEAQRSPERGYTASICAPPFCE